MKPFTEKEIKYLEKWKKIRRNKLRYYVVNVVPIALAVTLGSEVWRTYPEITDWNWLRIVTGFLLNLAIWFWLIRFQVNATEKRFNTLFSNHPELDH